MRKKVSLGINDLNYLIGENISKTLLQNLNNFYEDFKSRFWVTIGYPESMVDLTALKGYITQLGIKAVISPLHDMDKKADHELTDGEGNFYEVEYKKPHYHIMLVFGNTTTYSYVLKHCKALKCVTPKPVSSCLAMYRYFKHLDEDNKEKFIYDRPQDIIQHVNGFDLADLVDDDPMYKKQIRQGIEDLIIEWNSIITDYFSLIFFLRKNNMDAEYKLAVKEQKYFSVYISGARKHLRKKKESDWDIMEMASLAYSPPERRYIKSSLLLLI